MTRFSSTRFSSLLLISCSPVLVWSRRTFIDFDDLERNEHELPPIKRIDRIDRYSATDEDHDPELFFQPEEYMGR